ncbi:DUF1828 domain-containing protein [Phaeobacter italicus]|uniref:DUF1828 domain-containing protein n=1 Tax=Phaeobacter italicus TaxID=481446 RepID=UPI001CD602E5|nr:DUF1828 domain-containing protein [Phaeobacter italicus]MCA0856133.1 DUF1828 domain-containing protein [Phaeobacter italicus]
MTPDFIKSELCRTFCDGLSVSTVPEGLAVATSFILPDGDPAIFYVRETPDGFIFEDDGDFVATARASGISLDTGVRAQLFSGILAEGAAFFDEDTLQIRSHPAPKDRLKDLAPRFLSALIRARDLYLLSSENVASTFAEDVREALESRFGSQYLISEDDNADFAADFILRHKGSGLRAALIFAVNTNEKLLSALIRYGEQHEDDAPVIAMMDRIGTGGISNRNFMRAQNRGLPMPFFGADRNAAISFVEQHAKVH